MAEMYVKHQGERPVAYAYGDPWVAQALRMYDWQYPTEEEAIAAWLKYLEKEGRKEDG